MEVIEYMKRISDFFIKGLDLWGLRHNQFKTDILHRKIGPGRARYKKQNRSGLSIPSMTKYSE